MTLTQKSLYCFLVMFSLASSAKAYGVPFPCANCSGSVVVLLGGSNVSNASIVFMLSLLVFVVLLGIIRKSLVTKPAHFSKFYIASLVVSVFSLGSIGYFTSSYLDTKDKGEFAGKYSYNDKNFSFGMHDSQLINKDNHHEIQTMGKYLHDAQSREYFFKSQSNFYLVDFEKKPSIST